MTASIDLRRLGLLTAVAVAAALGALLWPTTAPAPPAEPHTATNARPGREVPSPGHAARERADHQARASQRQASSGPPPSAAEPRDTRDGEPPRSSEPATITAVDPADDALLASAADTAAAWATAFSTTRSDEDTADWLDRLRPHTTAELHAALAHSDRADLLGEEPRTAESLATEISAATAERIAVRVRLAFDDAADEHVLEVVVVPTPSGPRVDEVRL